MERKMATQKAELVFIPAPWMGHLPPTIEFAHRLVAQFPDQISITFLIMRFTSLDKMVESFIQSLKTNRSNANDDNTGQITFLELPFPENTTNLENIKYFPRFIDAYKPIVKQILLQKQQQQQQSVDSPSWQSGQRLAGLVIDMSCTPMIDVAHELDIPSYIFFSSGAAFLHIKLHFASFGIPDIAPALTDEGKQIPAEDESSVVLDVSGFKNPIPKKVLPDIFMDQGWAEISLDIVRRYPEFKGILINTFAELEPHLIHSLIDPSVPTIYPIGPIVNLKDESVSVHNNNQKDMIMSWLDSQPPSSVVFLCFGSMAIFNETQLKEIAVGLERSGHRFLWSLRRKTAWSHGSDGGEEEYLESKYLKQVLPEGFLTRTAGIGRVIGWAPQVSVLGHKAVGAFVSHCGWNSILESMWFGVPLITWPMGAEQQLNAFVLVHELGLAAEIRIDYKCNYQGEGNMVVREEEIEKGIRTVMDPKEERDNLREKVKRISEMGQNALLEKKGSSYQSMSRFVEDTFKNLS